MSWFCLTLLISSIIGGAIIPQDQEFPKSDPIWEMFYRIHRRPTTEEFLRPQVLPEQKGSIEDTFDLEERAYSSESMEEIRITD